MFDFSKYDVIVFDYDGVTIDSMDYWYHLPSKFIKYKGYNPKPDLDESISYYLTYDVAKKFIDEYKIDSTVDDLLKEMDYFIDITYPDNKPMHKIIDLLNRLKDKKKIVFSSSPSKIVINSLKKNNLFDYFDTIYTSNEYNISKYHTDGFEFIIEKLKISKNKILVLDNDIRVVKASTDAGIDTILILDEYNKKMKDEVKDKVLGIYKISDL